MVEICVPTPMRRFEEEVCRPGPTLQFKWNVRLGAIVDCKPIVMELCK